MPAFAAANRFRRAPYFARAPLNTESTTMAVSHLRKSITAETLTAAGLLALVSWLGTLAPVTAQ
jgi:putative copper resistance protein D